MKNDILHIDTTNNRSIKVFLDSQRILEKTDYGKIVKAEEVLVLIEKLLVKYHLKPEDLSEIKINTGPGSFTGIRVGLAVANAMAYALGIKVNGKEMEIEAKYED